jgi:very-long-chain enoyl-CoA reductase
MGNGYCHWYLASLRSDKTSREHILPMNVLFRWVVCPNYTFEIMGWALFSLLGDTYGSYFVVRALFCFVGAFQMYTWAGGKKRRYKKLFGDKYKVTGNLLPGI